MTQERTIYDEDMLTNQELEEIGLDPRVVTQHNRKAQKRCTECNKRCDTPTSKYTIKGIDIIQRGEDICGKCLNKRISTYTTLIQMVENGKIKMEDL